MVEPQEEGGGMKAGNKRNLEEEIQQAKQKAQEVAARILSDAESKRPRLFFQDDINVSKSTSPSNPPLPDDSQRLSSQQIANSQVGSVYFAALPGQYHNPQSTSKRITIPNGKVGVIIGRGGETIKYLQLQSGANIQITKDSEADPYSLTRDVELRGLSDQISRAEQLINDVITEADAGRPAPSAPIQPGTEQFTMKVPNSKVASLIGKGGETIKNIQSRSGALVQIIPLHLPPGDTSTERTVYMNGLKEQIESAKEFINEIVIGNRLVNPSGYGSSSYVQSAYGNWGQPGQYGYTQAPPPYYGAYPIPTQVTGSDQSNFSPAPPPPQQVATGYNYYQQQAHTSSKQLNFGYGYSQTPLTTNQSQDQGFSLQPPGSGQGIPDQVTDQGYGPTAAASQSDGITHIHSNLQSTVGSLYYSHPVATAQAGYGTTPTYMGPPAAHLGYGQTGIQSGNVGQQQVQVPPSPFHPVYGQGGYPSQQALAEADCVQGVAPAYEQPHSEPLFSGNLQPLIYDSEETGRRDQENGSTSGVEVVHSES